MVIDAAKGIEAQTRKLFEVCRLRNVPIVTFINKMDREARDPFDLLDEIEQNLALDVTPASWPIGMGRNFHGCYNLFEDRLILIERSREDKPDEGDVCEGLDDHRLDVLLPAHAVSTLRDEVEMARGLCPEFNLQAYREGHMTPVYFGSAINNFGVRELLEGLARQAPSPRSQAAVGRTVAPMRNRSAGSYSKFRQTWTPNIETALLLCGFVPVNSNAA